MDVGGIFGGFGLDGWVEYDVKGERELKWLVVSIKMECWWWVVDKCC